MIPSLFENRCLRIFIVLLSIRLLIFLFGVGLFVSLEGQTSESFFQIAQSAWARWDTRPYLSISTDGYSDVGDHKSDIVFFPVYPILIAIVSLSNLYHPFIAGLIISWIAFALAGVVLYKLIMLDFDRHIASRAVRYLAIFPFSFFFGMAYTESLFLLLVVSTMYSVRTRRWLWSISLLFLAGLTRLQGALLLIPVLLELFAIWQMIEPAQRRKMIGPYIREALLLTATSTASVLMYLALNKVVTGNWLQFLIYQNQVWFYTYQNVFSSIAQLIKLSFSEPNLLLRAGTWIPQVIIFFLSLFLLITGFFHKVRKSYLIYWAFHIVVSFSSTWLLSGVRFMLPMFMMYLILAVIVKKRIIDLLIIFCLFAGSLVSIWLFLKNVVV